MAEIMETGPGFFKLQSFAGSRPAILEALSPQVTDPFVIPQMKDLAAYEGGTLQDGSEYRDKILVNRDAFPASFFISALGRTNGV